MDPVSLSLAIVPLLISAAENYKNVYDTAQNFKKASKDIQRLEKHLRAQSLHFDEHRRALLMRCVDEDVQLVEDMLADGNHAQWKAAALQPSMEDALGNSLQRYCLTVSLVVEALVKLHARIGKLKDAGVRRRLVFAMNKTDYESDLDSLRDLLMELATIRLQKATLLKQKVEQKTVATRIGGNTHAASSAPKASSGVTKPSNVPQNLYEALLKACKEHREHSAHLHLEITPSQIDDSMSFELILQPQKLCTASVSGQTWLKIVTDFPIGHNPTIPEVTNLLSDMNLKRTPAIQTTHAILPPPVAPPNRVSSFDIAENLCTDGSLCSRLQKRSEKEPMIRQSCIGFVEDEAMCRHAVFMMPPAVMTAVQEAAYSLSMLLSGVKPQAQTRQLSPFERFRLARQISGAILQLSNTSWLDPLVSTEQILLYGLEEDPDADDELTTPRPYLDVAMRDEVGIQARGKAPGLPPTIRNAVLYRLGVILIELAFEKSLKELQTAEDLFEGREHPGSDLNTAARSSKKVSSKMGRRYARVVERCLWCNFACGESELESPTMQRNVYRDVVGELKEIERGQMEILGY